MCTISFTSDELAVLIRATLNFYDLNEKFLSSERSEVESDSDYERMVRKNLELSKILLDKLNEDLSF